MVCFRVRKLVLAVALPALLFAVLGGAAGFAVGKYMYPHTAAWDMEIENLRAELRGVRADNVRLEDINAAQQAQIVAFSQTMETPEGAYYRGVMTSCIGIGLQMGLPNANVVATCTAYWKAAYKADWFTVMDVDEWTWPPKDAGE
jgi:hypothetical protein